jgi:hypothetical protein
MADDNRNDRAMNMYSRKSTTAAHTNRRVPLKPTTGNARDVSRDNYAHGLTEMGTTSYIHTGTWRNPSGYNAACSKKLNHYCLADTDRWN